MNLQQHLEIQASAQQWVDDFMKNYNVTATEMIDALNSVLLTLKDKSMVEYLTEVVRQQQEAIAAAQQQDMQNQALQEEMQEQTPQEEVNGG